MDQEDNEAAREGETLPKLDQVDQMEGSDTDDKGKEDAQVQGHGFNTNEEPAELTGDRRRCNKYDWLHVRHIASEDFNSEEENESGDKNKSSDELTGDRMRDNKYDWLHIRHIAAEDVNSKDESKSGDKTESRDKFGDESESDPQGQDQGQGRGQPDRQRV